MALYLGSQKCSGVNVKTECALQSKTATPSAGAQTIVPDSGYDGLSNVTVSAIPSSYVPSGYVKPSGTKSITSNGTHNVTNYASVSVNVASSGGSTTMCSGTITSNYYTYLVYYSDGSSVKNANLTSSLSVSVPKGSIVAVYSGWGEISENTLTNATKIITSYNCDSCGECMTVYEVTGSNFKIGLY